MNSNKQLPRWFLIWFEIIRAITTWKWATLALSLQHCRWTTDRVHLPRTYSIQHLHVKKKWKYTNFSEQYSSTPMSCAFSSTSFVIIAMTRNSMLFSVRTRRRQLTNVSVASFVKSIKSTVSERITSSWVKHDEHWCFVFETWPHFIRRALIPSKLSKKTFGQSYPRSVAKEWRSNTIAVGFFLDRHHLCCLLFIDGKEKCEQSMLGCFFSTLAVLSPTLYKNIRETQKRWWWA